jgi:hypothetical protein
MNVAIETAFEELQRALEDLKGEMEELRVNAADFYPETRGGRRKNGHKTEEAPPPPVVSLADQATDLEGELEEGLQASRKACQAVRHPRNLAEAQIALDAVQRTLNRILRQLLMEVASYDTLQTLFQMGRQRGQGWPAWSAVIKSVIDICQERTLAAFEALAECWQELADKLATNSISVQATNIGQQITAPERLASTAQEFT